MASNSGKKNKTSGLRMLWIPGRKNHSKGRLSTTNKHISYSPTQKKSEVWTLGGSKIQNELLDLPESPEITGASTSSLATVAAMSSMLVKSVKPDLTNHENKTFDDALIIPEPVTQPATPIATISPNLNSPLSELAPSTPSTTAMASPVVVTTVKILDLHNINVDDLPKPPSFTDHDLSLGVALNSSAGTTASIATNSSPMANRKANNQSAVNNSSHYATPQKGRYKNHNNNQDDINSIESISSFNQNQVSTDFDWIDDMVQQRHCKEQLHKNKRKKPKKLIESKESDQLDGIKLKEKFDSKSLTQYDDNDEKVVKCLYYSLMCCDCTIS